MNSVDPIESNPADMSGASGEIIVPTNYAAVETSSWIETHEGVVEPVPMVSGVGIGQIDRAQDAERASFL